MESACMKADLMSAHQTFQPRCTAQTRIVIRPNLLSVGDSRTQPRVVLFRPAGAVVHVAAAVVFLRWLFLNPGWLLQPDLGFHLCCLLAPGNCSGDHLAWSLSQARLLRQKKVGPPRGRENEQDLGQDARQRER